MMFSSFLFSVFTLGIGQVSSHGRFIEPPSRTSAWRFGFGTPSFYNDHETNCGGFIRHWEKNGGLCGVCGDAWDLAAPRDGEGGGKFGRGVIVRSYTSGQTIRVRTDITANHGGYFQFSICPHNNPSTPATQNCLDRNLLKFQDGTTKFYLRNGTGTHSTEVIINMHIFNK